MSEMAPAPQVLIDRLTIPAEVTPLPCYDATPDPTLASLKELDLHDHLARFEGLVFNGNGSCLCPVHAEKSPSFEVKRHTDGHWYWFDWHNQGRAGFSGTIIDFYIVIKGLSVGEAIRTIREREGIRETTIGPVLKPPTLAIERATTPKPTDELAKPFEGTLGQFLLTQIPKPTPLVHDLINENEFMLLGGVKGSHKTTVMMTMGLAFASGKEFLGFKPARAGRFLMIQQELSEGEFQKRLRAAVLYGGFDADNFIPYTSTVDQIKLLTLEGGKRLEDLFDKFKPDWIGLDPLSKFHRANESDPRIWAEVRDLLHQIVITHGSVVLSQHFTSKRAKDDPTTPVEAAGWFRGSSILADSADVLFCLHRLPGQKDNPRLQHPYEDYNQVVIELRNGRWPARFATEFNETSFLLTLSDVWHELGAKIGFGEVREVSEAHGGSILMPDLVLYFKTRDKELSPHTVKKAVEKEVQAGYVTTEKLPGRGGPLLIRSRGGQA